MQNPPPPPSPDLPPAYEPQPYEPAPYEPSPYPPLAAEVPPPSKPTGRRVLPLVLVGVLAGAIIGGAAGATLVAQRQGTTASAGHAPFIAAPSSTSTSASIANAVSATAIYQQDSPGVVVITSTVGGTFRSTGEATGSGIVVDAQGDILTNEHVVAGATQTRVTFKDGTIVTGTVAGTDASDDLAVVHVSVSAGELHPLALANSDAVQVGEPVLAIGTPFGLEETLTSGIISGLNRSSTAPSGRALTGMIQTDAAINPGNSGGPLLNARGEVIGVDESIQSPVQGSVGVGFAVPINRAKTVLPALEKGQAVQHPWLGISGQTITPTTADSLSLSQKTGVLVVQVIAGSPAEKAGLKASGTADSSDDIITAIDGHNLASVEALTNYLDTKHVGDKVTLTISRGGKSQSISATLADFQSQNTGG